MDEQIVNKNLQVTFLGEIDLDEGLTKELFNIFFIKCDSIFFSRRRLFSSILGAKQTK